MQNFENWQEQRMTDVEAQEVMRLLAERQRRNEDLHAMPSVRDVAMLANSHVTDVAEALNEIRSRCVMQPVVPRQKPWIIPLVAICSACAVMVVLATLFVALRATPQTAELAPPAPPIPMETAKAMDFPPTTPGSAVPAPTPEATLAPSPN